MKNTIQSVLLVGFLLLSASFALAQTELNAVSDPYGTPPPSQPNGNQVGTLPKSPSPPSADGKPDTMDPTKFVTVSNGNVIVNDVTVAEELRNSARRYMLTEKVTGTNVARATGSLVDYGTELAQILGQIVVDRASAQAYELLKTKTEELLECNSTKALIDFEQTCDTVQATRLQDLAASPTPLLKAVAIDGLMNIIRSNLPQNDTVLTGLFDRNIEALIVAAIKQAQGKVDVGTPEVLVSELLARVVVDASIIPNSGIAKVSDGQKAVLISALTVLKCKQQNTPNQQCKYTDMVDEFATAMAQGSAEIRVGAKSLTKSLLVALTHPTPNASIRPQYHAAAEAIFDAACMLASTNAVVCGDQVNALAAAVPAPTTPPITTTAAMQAPAMSATAASPTVARAVKALCLAENTVLAAIDGDGNEIIKSMKQIVDVLAAGTTKKSYLRGLQICGSILNYSATYTAKDMSSADAHQARQKILESLTVDMSNRIGREGDSIWSVGGSLRAAAGARFGRGSSSAFYGPISLPLGFGYQNRSGSSSFHAELSLIDLGQYVSFQEGGTVQSPDAAAALAPSITLGVAWGKQLPYFVAATGGYSPQYKFKDSSDKRGAFFAGLVFGIYVPFLDLN